MKREILTCIPRTGGVNVGQGCAESQIGVEEPNQKLDGSKQKGFHNIEHKFVFFMYTENLDKNLQSGVRIVQILNRANRGFKLKSPGRIYVP